MPEPDEPQGRLPDVLRSSNAPIIIYQGAPPQLDVQTNNALGLLSWLALLTVCLSTIIFCVWQVWNPAHDQTQFSPVYANGRPLGLAGQIEERRQINERAEGLLVFLDGIRSDSSSAALTHPLMSDRDGIDDLRRRWDAMCLNVRSRIYDRRIGQLDARMVELRRRTSRERDTVERARLRGELQALARQRNDQIEIRRTDSDPSLQCVPAEQAPVCSGSNDNEWCHPERKRPRDFVDQAS